MDEEKFPENKAESIESNLDEYSLASLKRKEVVLKKLGKELAKADIKSKEDKLRDCMAKDKSIRYGFWSSMAYVVYKDYRALKPWVGFLLFTF